MSLNINKCEVMHMSRKRSPIISIYNLCNEPLAVVNSVKYLGVTINDKLSWDTHTAITVKKGFSSLYSINRTLKDSTKAVRELAYKTVVRPIMDYCGSVCDPSNVTEIEQIERVNRKAIRLVTKTFDRNVSTSSLLSRNQWPSL